MTTAAAQPAPSPPPPSPAASRPPRLPHLPKAASSTLRSSPLQAQTFLLLVAKRLRSLPPHEISRLTDPILPLLGITDPVAWMGQTSHLADCILTLLFSPPRTGPANAKTQPLDSVLAPRYASVLAYLTTQHRQIADIDDACRIVCRLAASDYLSLLADQHARTSPPTPSTLLTPSPSS